MDPGAIGTKMILGKQGLWKYKNILEIHTRSWKKLSVEVVNLSIFINFDDFEYGLNWFQIIS